MATTVGEVAIDIRAKFDRLQTDMDGAKAAVKSGAGEIEALTTMIGGYMAAVGIGNLGGLINSTIEAAAALQHLSEMTGATVEGLSAIKSVAKLSGTDIDSVAGAMNKLTKNLTDTTEESKGAAQAISALGLNFEAFKALSPDQQMLTVAKALDQFKDGAAKSQAAMLLFGKAGASMLPMLKDLAEKGSLAGKVTAEQAAAADAFEKSMVKMKTGMEGVIRSAIMPLLPLLTTLGPLFAAAAKIAAAYFAVFIAGPAIITVMVTAFNAMALAMYEGAGAGAILNASILTLGPTFEAMTASMGVFKVAMLSVFGVLAAAFAGWEIGKWLSDNFVEARLAGVAFIDGLMTGWEYVKYGAQVAWLGIQAAAAGALDWVGGAFAGLLDKMSKGLSFAGLDSASEAVSGYADALRTTTASATDFTTEHAALKAGLDTAVAGVHAITGDMADEAIAHGNVASAAGKNAAGKAALVIPTAAAASAAKALADKITDVIGKLADEIYMLSLSAEAAEIYKQQKAAGVKSDTEAGKAIEILVKQLFAQKGAMASSAAAAAAAASAMEAYNAANVREVATIQDAISKEEERIATLGMSRAAVEAYKLAKMESNLADLAGNAAEDADAAQLRKKIAMQKELVGVMQKGDAADAGKKAADESAAWWDKASKDIETSLTNGLAKGWKNGKDILDSISDYITGAFKSMTVKIAVQPVMGAMNTMGAAIFGSADGGASGSSGNGVLGAISNGKSIYDVINGGFSMMGSKVASSFADIGASLVSNSAPGSMMDSIGGSMINNSSAVGVGASYLGAGAMGIMGGSMIAGNKSFLGMNGSTAATVGAVIGSIFGPVGTMVGGLIGGVVNRAFGQGPKELGGTTMSGKFGAGQATNAQTSTYWHQDGGWFSSGKEGYDIKGIDAATQGGLDSASKSVLDSVTALATGLKLPTDDLKNITSSFAVALTGNVEDDKKALEGALVSYQTALTGSMAGALAPFQHAGEALIDTMQRLAVIEVARGALNEFGGVFSKIAGAGVNATEAMIALAGGLDKLIAKSQAFVSSYYSQDEQAGIAAKGVLSALNAAGIANAGQLDNKADFRSLVESIDVSTASGQATVNALLDIAPQFAALAQTMADQKTNLGDLAGLAPQVATLEPLFATSSQTAAAATTAAADATTAAIATTTSAVQAGTSAVVGAIDAMGATVANAVQAGMAAANSTSTVIVQNMSSIAADSRLAAAA